MRQIFFKIAGHFGCHELFQSRYISYVHHIPFCSRRKSNPSGSVLHRLGRHVSFRLSSFRFFSVPSQLAPTAFVAHVPFTFVPNPFTCQPHRQTAAWRALFNRQRGISGEGAVSAPDDRPGPRSPSRNTLILPPPPSPSHLPPLPVIT